MLSLKAFLILSLLIGAIAAGTAVYNVWDDENFSADLRILSAVADGEDILMDVELRLTNKMDLSFAVRTLRVTIMNEDKTISFITEAFAPPLIHIQPHSTVVKTFQVRLTNINSLGTVVVGIVDVVWTSGSDTFSLHREMPIDITKVL